MQSSLPQIKIHGDPKTLAVKAADLLLENAKEAVKARKSFFVALSGGSTPRAMHRLLIQEPYRSEIPWRQMHIFWVDERCVPVSDPASNFGAAKEDFIDLAPITNSQVHPMPGEVEPEQGALKYQEDLVASFRLKKEEFPVFDIIFLGLGTDGHTASLFPDNKALDEIERMVVSVKGGEPAMNRLTLTFPVLNHARGVVFMVSGKEKAPIVKAMLKKKETTLPAQRVKPHHGQLVLLMDKEAASML